MATYYTSINYFYYYNSLGVLTSYGTRQGTSTTKDKDVTLYRPSAPYRYGAEFVGWGPDRNPAGSSYVRQASYTKTSAPEYTSYAYFNIKITISYDPNGGYFIGTDGRSYYKTAYYDYYDYNVRDFSVTIPTGIPSDAWIDTGDYSVTPVKGIYRSGYSGGSWENDNLYYSYTVYYSFAGWDLGGRTVYGSVTAQAQWSPSSYGSYSYYTRIKCYNISGSEVYSDYYSSTSSSASHTYILPTEQSHPSLVIQDKTLIGWSTTSGSDTPEYTPGQEVSMNYNTYGATTLQLYPVYADDVRKKVIFVNQDRYDTIFVNDEKIKAIYAGNDFIFGKQ